MGFTAAERDMIRPFLEGAVAFTHGLYALGDAIEKGLTTKTRPAYVAAATEMARTARDVGAGALGVVGGLPLEMAGRGWHRGETVAAVVPEVARSAQLEYAWNGPPFGITRAIGTPTEPGTLSDAIRAVLPLSPTAAEYVNQTLVAFRALDRGALIHSDPPPGLTHGGRRTTIGPHADFYESQHWLTTSQHYMNDWAQEGFVPVLAAIQLKYKAPLAGSWRVYAMLFREVIHVMALNVGIPLYKPWESLPSIGNTQQFAWTLEALWLLTRAVDMRDGEGMSELYKAHQLEWLQVLPGLTRSLILGAWSRGMGRTPDSWARKDNGAGYLNHFPDRRAG